MWLEIRRTRCFAALGGLLAVAVLAVPAVQAAAPDALERALGTRVAAQAPAPPDAFMRGVESLRPGRVSVTVFQSAARAGSAGRTTASATAPVGFRWSDFGIGAAAGIGFFLVLGGVGVALAVARRGGRTTSV